MFNVTSLHTFVVKQDTFGSSQFYIIIQELKTLQQDHVRLALMARVGNMDIFRSDVNEAATPLFPEAVKTYETEAKIFNKCPLENETK